jgi:peroxiredoxin
MRSEDEDEEPKEGSSHIGQKKRKKSTIAKTKPASNVALSLAVETFTPTCTTRNLGIYDYLYN